MIPVERILAIDPSLAKLHIAVPIGDAPTLLCVSVQTKRKQIGAFFAVCKRLGVNGIVYEDCYFSKNTQTYAQLYSLREHVKEIAQGMGLSFETASASEWQALLLTRGESSSGIARSEWKRRSAARAAEILGYAIDDENFADAICFWKWREARGKADGEIE